MRLMIAIAMLAASVAITPAAAQSTTAQSRNAETLSEKDVPATVTSRLRCKSPAGPVTRRPLAGGFVFSQPCTDGADTLIRIVYATDRDGADARLLQFHRPEGRRMSALATAVFDENEIGGSTLRLTRRICRAEGRWRLEGKKPSPGLVFWRQTRDCEGKGGWQTMLGKPR